MKDMKDPFLIHGPLRGPCSICGTPAQLTVDHVPPKGIAKGAAMEMRALMDRLSIDKVEGKFQLSQGGVKFRSLCPRCNNERLGAECDPELLALCNHADRVMRSPLALPPSFTVDVRPMRVLRSIVGHMLATESGRQPVGPMEEAMADFFLDTRLPPPRQLECFYWPYPFNDQVILREVSLGRMGGHPPLFFKLLKFYPLSFMLTWERHEATWDFRMQDLARYRRLGNDDTAALVIDLQAVPPQRWPEAPLNDCMLMMAGKPMIAEPRNVSKQRR